MLNSRTIVSSNKVQDNGDYMGNLDVGYTDARKIYFKRNTSDLMKTNL